MKDKQKVLIAINCMNVGGAPSVVLEQLRSLDQERFEPWLLTLYPSKAANLLGEARQVIDVDHVVEFRLARRSPFDLKTLFVIRAFLKQERFDVVVTHLFLANLIIRVIAVCARVPRIIAYEHSRYEGKRLWQKIADHVLAKRTYRLVVAQEEIARFTAHQERIPLSRFEVIPNPVMIPAHNETRIREVREAWSVPEGRTIFLTLGRFSDEKGQGVLIDALARLAKERNDFFALIVGHGPRYETLLQAVHDAGIEDLCRVVSDPERARYAYRLADLFVLPSLREGESIVTKEAFLSGLPVVASDLPTLHALVEGAGWLVAPGDTDALVAALKDALQYPDLRMRYAITAKEKAKRFDNTASARAFERLLTNAP